MKISAIGGGSTLHLIADSGLPRPISGRHLSQQHLQRTKFSQTSIASLSYRPVTWINAAPKGGFWESFLDDESDETEEMSYKRSFKKGKERKRDWWSEYKPVSMEQEEDEILRNVLDFFDNFLVFKVLNKFGWYSVPILVSWILAGGPKAFIQAFGVALGLSIVLFAYETLSKVFGGAGSVQYAAVEQDLGEMKAGESKVKSKGMNSNGAAQKVNEDEDEDDYGGWDSPDLMDFTEPHQVKDTRLVIRR